MYGYRFTLLCIELLFDLPIVVHIRLVDALRTRALPGMECIQYTYRQCVVIVFSANIVSFFSFFFFFGSPPFSLCKMSTFHLSSRVIVHITHSTKKKKK